MDLYPGELKTLGGGGGGDFKVGFHGIPLHECRGMMGNQDKSYSEWVYSLQCSHLISFEASEYTAESDQSNLKNIKTLK